MLPSTGYFKAINCPFYENGACDRPYCHFKHSKREDVGVTTEATEAVESSTTDQIQVSGTSTMVVDTLTSTLTSKGSGTLDPDRANTVEERTDVSTSVNKSVPCVYNPTPIAELKKRHIPIISYMPTRESRVAVKRKCSIDGAKPWLAVGCISTELPLTNEIKYKPTMIANSDVRDSTQNYVPTFKSDSAPSYFYKDDSSNEYLLKLRESYYPKCKRRREEYVPKKVKTPLKTAEGLHESALDQFEANFDVIKKTLTCVESTSVTQSKESLQDSCFELEPKFSDDEDDNCNSQNVNKIDSEHADCASIEQNKDCHNVGRFSCLITGHDTKSTEECSKANVKSKHTEEKNFNRKMLRSSNVLEQEEQVGEEISKPLTMEVDSDRSTNENRKEHERRDKSKEKDHKNRHKSHKRYKDKHDTNKSSYNKDKSNSHEIYGKKKGSKDTRRDKDQSRHKDRKKHRSKERNREKDKTRHKTTSRKNEQDCHKFEHEAKNCSDSSRKQKHSEKSVDESKYSKNDRQSNDKTSEKYIHTECREGRSSTDRFAGSVESVRIDPTNDDNEENNDCVGNIIDVDIDVTFSTSDSDHDVQEECLKIFQEYKVPEHPKTMETPKEPSLREKEQNEEVGRKRVAHPSAATSVTRVGGVNQQAKKVINPQQRMYERWRLIRDAAAEKSIFTNGDTGGADISSSSRSGTGITKDVRRNCIETPGTVCNSEFKLNGGNGRVRIAHVPYAKSLAIEKKKVTGNVIKSVETTPTDNQKTAAQTAKSGVRVAHVPQVVPQLIRPEPLQVATQKFPLNVRQYYVNMMHDVCVLIYINAEDAAQRAVKEEYACHERCKALAVYKNSCMLATHRLRKELDQNQSIENSAATTSASMVSHEAVLAGKSKGTWSVLKTKKSVTEFKGAALYGMLKKWIMTEQQLRDNGFPRPHPDGQKGRAKVYVINSRNQSVLSKVPNERVCCRCGQTYMIDKNGFALQPQNCIYHWGRKFTIRGEGKYSCCQQYGSATGCCDAKSHVWDYTDYENLRGYVKTLPKSTPIEEQGVYALDCEMCYTTQGLELTRITIIDEDCSVVYETLVKPQNPIIDYNTRFSGITEESMKDVTTTLLDVQATILTMFSEKTILVGHSLESDFKALRLLHNTVVDTSVMFPHKSGYPQKRALKNLCSEYLRKLIQNDVGGHDSKEDAMACMELILWKVKEEAKLQ